ncbi:MAG: trypsin-like serine protease, partial [Chloroflexi bacterium]|nr:trypsin-like serine protease [Chloroflexota bacterium]
DFSHRCSGSLLSPTVFLTAGHCTDETDGDLVGFRIWFQQDAGANYDPATQLDLVSGYPEYCAEGTLGVTCATGTEMHNMGFDDFAGFPEIQDVGVAILDQPIHLDEYGELAAVGSLNHLYDRQRGRQDVTFTVSGYGLSYSSPVAVESFRSRLMAESKLVNVKAGNNAGFNLQTSGNGGGRGGTCSGDSGGPVFYPADTNVVVAVTSFGLNAYCRGTDFAYRTDTQAVHDWLQSVLTEAEWDAITIS